MILMGFDKDSKVRKVSFTGKVNKKEAEKKAVAKGWTNLVFLSGK